MRVVDGDLDRRPRREGGGGQGGELLGPQAKQHLGQQSGEARLERDRARVADRLPRHHHGELRRGLLVGAVLQQAGEQQVPGLEQLEVLLVLDRAGREQPGGLEVEQRRGHHEELGRLAEVPVRAERADVGDELVGDLRQGERRDVELVLADQAEQQVERTLVLLEVDREHRTGGRGDDLVESIVGHRVARHP